MNLFAKIGEASWNYLKAAFNPYFLLLGILILAIVLGIMFTISAIKERRWRKK